MQGSLGQNAKIHEERNAKSNGKRLPRFVAKLPDNEVRFPMRPGVYYLWQDCSVTYAVATGLTLQKK